MSEVKEIPFDATVKAGEIRVFADFPKPFVALVVEERGLSGWRIVPVSPLLYPMSVRERMVGPRVFQLWNTCTASRRVVSRSWVVDTLGAAEVASLIEAIPAAFPGRITAGESPLARYEREHLVTGGNFSPFPGAVPNKLGTVPHGPSVYFAIFARFCRIAASFAVCVGVFYGLMSSGRENLRTLRESAMVVNVKPEDAVVELLDSPLEREIDENIGPNINFFDESLFVFGPLPNAELSLPELCDMSPSLSRLPSGLSPLIPKAISHLSPRKDFGYLDPRVMPLSVIERSAACSLADVPGGSSIGDSPQTGDSPRKEPECLTCACPWNRDAAILAVPVPGADGSRAEVFFDRDKVFGFRSVVGTDPGIVFYEVLLRGGGKPADGFCQVTFVRSASGAGSRRVVKPRLVEAAEVNGLPRMDGRSGAASGLADPGDVPVEIGF